MSEIIRDENGKHVRVKAEKKNDGGPAYPSGNELEINEVHTTGHPGMSLRDYFAGQAMVGILLHERGQSAKIEAIAKTAFNFADAMIEARNATTD